MPARPPLQLPVSVGCLPLPRRLRRRRRPCCLGSRGAMQHALHHRKKFSFSIITPFHILSLNLSIEFFSSLATLASHRIALLPSSPPQTPLSRNRPPHPRHHRVHLAPVCLKRAHKLPLPLSFPLVPNCNSSRARSAHAAKPTTAPATHSQPGTCTLKPLCINPAHQNVSTLTPEP